jgi:hypothetical protein
MHLLGTCVSIIGLVALVIILFLGVVRDLLSRGIFAAPSSSNEGRTVEFGDDERSSGPTSNADLSAFYGGRSARVSQS